MTARVNRDVPPAWDSAKLHIKRLILLERDTEAYSALEGLLKNASPEESVEIQMYQGLIHAIRGKYDEAMKIYKSIKIDTPALRECRAFVHAKSGKIYGLTHAIKEI